MNGTILITARAAQALSLKDESSLGDWLVSVVDPKDPKIVTTKADAAARQGRFLVLVVYIPSAAGKSAEEASALGNQVRKAISDLQGIAQKAAARAKSKQDHVPVCGVVDSFDPTAIPLGAGDIPLVSSVDKLTEWLHGLAHFMPRTSERTVRIIGADSGQEATAPQQKSPAGLRIATERRKRGSRGTRSRGSKKRRSRRAKPARGSASIWQRGDPTSRNPPPRSLGRGRFCHRLVPSARRRSTRRPGRSGLSWVRLGPILFGGWSWGAGPDPSPFS
jgi:hypothetical protein